MKLNAATAIRLLLVTNVPLGLWQALFFYEASLGYGPIWLTPFAAMMCRMFTAAALTVVICSAISLKLRSTAIMIGLRLGATLLAFGNLDLLRQAIWWMQDDGKPYVGFALQAGAWIVWLAVILALEVPRRPLTGDAARS